MPFFKPIMIALAVAVLGLCGWTWYQSQKISSLKAENQAQAETMLQKNMRPGGLLS